MTRRIATLIAAQAAVTALLWAVGLPGGAWSRGGLVTLAGFTLAYALLAFFPMRLEFERNGVTATVPDAVLAVALFTLHPAAIGPMAGIGEALACIPMRIRGLKLVFNVVSHTTAATVAAYGFNALGLTDPDRPASWLAAVGATLAYSGVNLVSIAGVLSIVERRPFRRIFTESAPTFAIATMVSVPVAIVAFELFRTAALGPLLLVPLALAVALNSKHATAQRDERLRFHRLYDASSRTAGLVSFDRAVARAAREALGLVSGTTAVCCTRGPGGEWLGISADRTGTRPVPAEMLHALVLLTGGQARQELVLAGADPALRAPLPGGDRLVLASSPADSPVPVLLGVFRDDAPGDSQNGRFDTLGAFAAQASLTLSNARLYEEVEAAFRQQVDLNRQKGEFVAAVSHELRTPLTAMVGSVGTVVRLADKLGADDQDRLLRMSLEQGDRLKRLIEELLLVAATEHVRVDCQRHPVDIDALVSRVGREVSAIAGGRFGLEVAAAIPVIETDEDKLHRVLINLIENAVKYAPSGPIVLRVGRTGDELTFSVVDHGPGIPAADAERVFERFVQLDQSSTRRNGGTGLGLYLCRQLAEVMGGSLTLDEADGGGCHFRLRIPAVEPAPRTITPADGPPSGVARRPRNLDGAGMHRRPAGLGPDRIGTVLTRPADAACAPAVSATPGGTQ